MVIRVTAGSGWRGGAGLARAVKLGLAVTLVAGAGFAAPLLAAGPALASGPDPVCSAGTCTVSFTTPQTGGEFTVPAGVSSLSVTLYGAVGGNNVTNDVAGGDGAEVTATLAVSPGQELGVDVGGTGNPAGEQGVGGDNGGGNAGSGGGAGGGFTDLANTPGGAQYLVAGGGGGGGVDGVGSASDCFTGNLILAGGAGGNADTAGSGAIALGGEGFVLVGGGPGGPGTSSGPGSGGDGGRWGIRDSLCSGRQLHSAGNCIRRASPRD